MEHSNNTIIFAYNLVCHYSKYDHISECHTLSISNISDFDLHELSSFLMAENQDYAVEATGPDNPNYEKTMLPALIKYMKNVTDKDEKIEFNNAWKEGITNYFENTMLQLLSEQLDKYNQEYGYIDSDDNSKYTNDISCGESTWIL